MWGILLLHSHSGFTGIFQYNQVLWRAQWVQKAVRSLVHSTVWSKLSSHLHSFLADTGVLLAPGARTRNRAWETDTFSPHPYFIAVSTQLKHFICASQLTFQFKCMFHPGEPHQFLLHTNIICPKESKGYRAKSYKVRQCQNWSFPCNLKLVLVVLQPTLTKLGLGNICLRAAENLFIE